MMLSAFGSPSPGSGRSAAQHRLARDVAGPDGAGVDAVLSRKSWRSGRSNPASDSDDDQRVAEPRRLQVSGLAGQQEPVLVSGEELGVAVEGPAPAGQVSVELVQLFETEGRAHL